MNVQKQVGWGTRNLTNFAPSLVTTYQVQPTSSVNASECWTATAKAIAISKGRPPAPPSFAHRALFDICTVHCLILFTMPCKLPYKEKPSFAENLFFCLLDLRSTRSRSSAPPHVKTSYWCLSCLVCHTSSNKRMHSKYFISSRCK